MISILTGALLLSAIVGCFLLVTSKKQTKFDPPRTHGDGTEADLAPRTVAPPAAAPKPMFDQVAAVEPRVTSGSVSYTYDSIGRLSTATINNVTTTYSYDTEGNRTSVVVEQSQQPEPPTTDLILWLLASQGVTTGTGVSGWADQSSAGNNATQTTAADQPALTQNAINGQPAVTFGGGGECMLLPSGFADFTSGLSLFIVTEPQSTLTEVLFSLSASGGSDLISVRSTSNDIQFLSGSRSVSGAGAENQWHMFEFIYDGGTTVTIYDKGTQIATGTITAIANATRTVNYLGAQGGSHNYQGAIAEILLYDAALSATDRSQVEDYLNYRYF